jgi:hypothetical protein
MEEITHNLKERISHDTASHRRIILRDLELIGRSGKTALAFREDYNIVDVPTAISKINRKEISIRSSYPAQYIVVDKDNVPRKTVKYWLVEYAPKVKTVVV